MVDTYQKFRTGELPPGVGEEKYAYVATPKELAENKYNLNIPRFVDTFEEEAEVDIADVQTKIKELEGELAQVETEMDKYLKELGVA